MQVREERWEDGTSTRFVHSETDQLERVEDYDAKGDLMRSVDYRYDGLGRNIERIVQRAGGKLLRRLTFEFRDGMKGAVHREYDENDKLVFTRVSEIAE
jgi:hypothetical protein